MNNSVQFRTILGGTILTVIWVCCFLLIKSTLVIEFGGGINMNFKGLVVFLGLLVIVFYHIFNRPNPETTKLSLTTDLTIAWLALIIFYPFKDPSNQTYSGAVAFFTLMGGLAVCVLWVHFFADEIV